MKFFDVTVKYGQRPTPHAAEKALGHVRALQGGERRGAERGQGLVDRRERGWR